VADILPFKKPPSQAVNRANSLCRNGHHKWVVVTSQQFDVKQGKLVTVSECARCAKRKVQAL
jgi:hypothetical protein